MSVSNATLQAVFALQDNYTTAIRKIMQSQEEYEKKQKQIDEATKIFQQRIDNMSAKSDDAANGIGRLTAKIGTLVSVAYLAKKGFDAMWASVNTSAMQKMQETSFGALLGNNAAGSAVYKYVSAYARQSMLGREDLAKGMTTFLTFSRDAAQLERMIKMVERLYAKDPTQGAEGAVFALKEILSGDTLSMRNRYGISGFSGESIRKKMAAGDVTGALDEIDAVMTKYGASQAVVDANFQSMNVQMDMFKTNLQSAFGEAATPLMEQFGAMWARLNADMESGKFQPAIDALVMGFNAAGSVAIWAAENMNTLIPVVGGLVTAVVIYKTAKLAMMAVEAASIPITWAAIGPYALLAAAVLGVAAAFGLANGGMSSFTDKLGNLPSVSDAYKQMDNSLQKIPAEITNSDPIKVTGDVKIEEENLKYLMDFAGVKYFASYSHIVPQVNMNGVVVNEMGVDDVVDAVTQSITNAANSQPNGEGGVPK